MNRFFSNNLPWKIVSLLSATLLWVFVINTQNPVQTREISNLPIEIKGLEAIENQGFVLQNEAEIRAMNFRVVVKGPRLEMETLMGKTPELEARIDLTPYTTTLTSVSTEKAVAIQIVGDRGDLRIEEIKPRTISVVFAKEETIQKEISAKITGINSNEYIAQEPILKPGVVEIIGTADQLKKVHRAVVDVDISDFSEDVITYKLPINLLNADGEQVEGVKSVPEEIEVVLPIGKKKQVPLEVQFAGKLPAGYIKSNTITTPEQIMIVGKSDVVDNIHSIKLEPIVLDNMIQSDTFQVEPILPKGVERIDFNDIAVTIEVQKEIPYEYTIDTRELKLQVLGLAKPYELMITQPTISIKLQGTAENLLQFNVKDVQAVIDLKVLGELKAGKYNVPITIKIPNSLNVLSGVGIPQMTLGIEIINTDETFEETDTELEEEPKEDVEEESKEESQEESKEEPELAPQPEGTPEPDIPDESGSGSETVSPDASGDNQTDNGNADASQDNQPKEESEESTPQEPTTTL